MVTSDNEDDQVQPPRKKKNRTNVLVESDTNTDKVCLIEEPPKTSKIYVFSHISEDSQDTCANKTPNSDDSGNVSTGENNTSDENGGESDEEWGYSQLDEMATKDAKVSNLSP